MNKKAIFINTSSQVIVRFITLAFTLISIKLLTKYLGPAGVGDYNTITTYVNLFIVLADLGIFAVAVREISKNPEMEKVIIKNVFTLRFITASLASIISIFLVFFTNYSQNIKLGVIIATLFLFFNLLSSVYDVILQYRLKMQYSATAEFLSKLIGLAALYMIIKFHGNFLWVISTIAISGLTIFILKWIFASRFVRFKPEYDKKIILWVFNLSWPLGMVFIVNNLYFKLDTLMLYVMKGSVAVGIYSVSYKILEVSIFVSSYFASALKPVISKEIDQDKETLANMIQKSILIMMILAIPISISCISFSKEIILFLSTSDFLSGSRALILLAFTLPLIYLDLLLGEILVAKDSRKLMMKISIFILSFNLIANLILIPMYSFMGAAFTTLLSELVLLVINIHYTKKIIPYHVGYKNIFKLALLFLATLIFSLLIRQANLYFLFLIAIIFIAYAIFAQISGLVSYRSVRSMFSGE